MTKFDIPGDLVEQIQKGDCVVFVGPDIYPAEGDLPNTVNLANRLAERSEYSEPDKSLARVAQWYENTLGRQSLVAQLRESVDDINMRPLKIHNLIARLPFKFIVTTNYDTLLERALRKNGKPFVKVVGNEEISFIDGQKVLLVKLHGCIDQPRTIVVTRRDHMDFVEKLPTVSNVIKALFVTKTLFFIGYNLSYVTFDNIYREATRRVDKFARRAYAIRKSPSPPDVEYWKAENIEVLDIEAAEFLEQLQRDLDELRPTMVKEREELRALEERYTLECATGIEMSDEDKILLFDLFRESELVKKIRVEHRHEKVFGRSSRIFRVLLYDEKDRVFNSRVVKIGKYSEIDNERKNYNSYVWPYETLLFLRVEEQSNERSGDGAISYVDPIRFWQIKQEEGQPTRRALTFKEVYSEKSTEELVRKIKIIYNHLGSIYEGTADFDDDIPYRKYFNLVLPADITVKVEKREQNELVIPQMRRDNFETLDLAELVAKSNDLHEHKSLEGKLIHLENLRVVEQEYSKLKLTDADEKQFIRVDIDLSKVLADDSDFNRGEHLNVYGRIERTRMATFLSKLREVFPDIEVEQVRTSLRKFPNPLFSLNEILNRRARHLKVSVIHNDLHTSNIITERDNVGIMDYGHTCEGPTVMDFIKLETEIKTNIFPIENISFEEFSEMEFWLGVDMKENFESNMAKKALFGYSGNILKASRIICEIRKAAMHHTGKEHIDSWADNYLTSLFLFSLACLKFPSVESLRAQFAFASAAIACAHL